MPNGAHLSMMQARILKGEGMTAGVSDLILLHPSADGKWAALCLEMKAGKGRQSELQKAWQKAVESCGCYRYAVVRSFDEFRELINSYL